MDTLKLIVSNEKFWGLVFLLVSQIKDRFLPQFPEDIWTTMVAIIALVVSILFVRQVQAERKEAKAIREFTNDPL